MSFRPQPTRIAFAISVLLLHSLDAQPLRSEETGASLLTFDEKPRTIVCLGDSVTGVYYHTGGVRAYPEMLEIALRKLFPQSPVRVINAGISGHTTQNGLDRLDRDVLSKKPDLVTVSFGLNDMVRVSPEDYRKNLETIVARCREIGSQVVLCTPNTVLDTSSRPHQKLIAYCEILRAVAKEKQAPVCDQFIAGEADRKKDPRAWRLTLSDAIHPNMDGHKRMAEELCFTITGRRVSLADVPPPAPAISKVLESLKKREPVRVVAMPPFDVLIGPAIGQLDPAAKIEVTPWPTEGQTLAQLRQASAKVRAMKPDLVVIAVPRTSGTEPEESYTDDLTWVMNNSLSFGLAEWDCLVVHPSVAAPGESSPRDALYRRLVSAQHLHLLDRKASDARPANELLVDWLKTQRDSK